MNIVTLQENLVNGKHVLTQAMLNLSDTIYIANYDYVIEVSNLKLPFGSELRIDGGSISGNPIYLPSSDNDTSKCVEYSMLLVGPHVADGSTTETDTDTPYLLSGSFIKSYGVRSFTMALYGDCRIALAGYGTGGQCLINEGELKIVSSKDYTIQIDGKTELSFSAENCNFQRIFRSANTVGFEFVNRSNTAELKVVMTNCKIWAYDCKVNSSDSDYQILRVGTQCAGTARLILRDCTLDNVGVGGKVYIDNCKFFFGNNLKKNHESVHCGSYSRVMNSTFDGRGACREFSNTEEEDTECGYMLDSDVIDVFNGHDIVIENCTFVNYINDPTAAPCLITIKSHYIATGLPDSSDQELDSHKPGIGQQIGVTVKNCFFDLPDFGRNIIEVWNGVRVTPPVEDRTLNRQFTNIESNFLQAPKATFVACANYSDHVRICNNSGQVNMLVFARDNMKFTVTDANGNSVTEEYPNVNHNLIISDNTLAYYGTDAENGHIMTILYGSCFHNLVLSGNTTNGYVWNGINYLNAENLSGTIRVIDNEATGIRGIFQVNTSTPIRIPDDVNFFMSGNVTNGQKLDVGTFDGVNKGALYIGRQYFCTSSPHLNKLIIYDGEDWVEA